MEMTSRNMDNMMKRNNIKERQNEAFSIDMLSAQRHYYSMAKCVVYATAFFCVIVVTVLSILNRAYSNEILGNAVLAYSIIAFLLNTILTNERNKLQTLAAQIQHLFDTRLFELQWDTALCGVEPRVEYVERGKQEKRNKLDDWYKDVPEDLPLDAVTLVCLRMNVAYDQNMKRKFNMFIYCVFLIIIIAILASNFQRTLWEMAIFTLVPMLPVVKFFYDVKGRIESDKERLIRLDVRLDTLMKNAIRNGIIERNELQNISNLIYEHRRTSPLVPDWLYYLLRGREETTADYSAKHYYHELRNVYGG